MSRSLAKERAAERPGPEPVEVTDTVRVSVPVRPALAPRAVAVQTLFYQLAFSAPLLVLLSLALEDRVWLGGSGPVYAALFYQCIVVAFLSYVVWFELIHRHPVSLVAAFTFFTPVFGVLISGVVILGEPLTGAILVSLILVIAGMFLVNRPGKQVVRVDTP